MKTASLIFSALVICAMGTACDFNTMACKYGDSKVIAPTKAALALVQTVPSGQRISDQTCAQVQRLLTGFGSYAGDLDSYVYSRFATRECIQSQDNSGCYTTPRGDQVCYWSPSTCLEYGPDLVADADGYTLAKTLEGALEQVSVVNLCDGDPRGLEDGLSGLLTAFEAYSSKECVAPRSGD